MRPVCQLVPAFPDRRISLQAAGHRRDSGARLADVLGMLHFLPGEACSMQSPQLLEPIDSKAGATAFNASNPDGAYIANYPFKDQMTLESKGPIPFIV